MSRSPKPDLVHKLPHPRALPDHRRDPFVGNETVDDNLAELAQLAMWRILGADEKDIVVTVDAGVIGLSGRVRNASQLDAISKAIRAIEGVRAVTSHIVLANTGEPSPPGRDAPEEIAAEPFLYLVRYCGLEEASMSAAIGQAVEQLDGRFAAGQLPAPERLFVIYRNLRANTVTLEIGMPTATPVAIAGSGLKAGLTPSGPTLSAEVPAGVAPMLAAVATLRKSAVARNLVPANFWWQCFAAQQFRPWQGHPAATVCLPVSKTAKAV